jgi:hypothetical protein
MAAVREYRRLGSGSRALFRFEARLRGRAPPELAAGAVGRGRTAIRKPVRLGHRRAGAAGEAGRKGRRPVRRAPRRKTRRSALIG